MTVFFSELLRQMRDERLPLSVDSRKAEHGGVFVVLNETAQSEHHVRDAQARGAAFIVRQKSEHACPPAEPKNKQSLTENQSNDQSLPKTTELNNTTQQTTVFVNNTRLATAELAAAHYDTADIPFPLFGVTGTNGKTTVSTLCAHLFEHMGLRHGLIGTIATRWPGHEADAEMTTPDAPELHAMLHAMNNAGVEVAVMEVSSHALDQARVACIPFKGAIFTNLTQDHLDYHKTFEDYYQAKARLFLENLTHDTVFAVCTDNPWGQRLVQEMIDNAATQNIKTTTHNDNGAKPLLITFGLNPQAPAHNDIAQNSKELTIQRLQGTLLSSTTEGLRMQIETDTQQWLVSTPLVGLYNAENMLAVQALGFGLGYMPEQLTCFETFQGVCGRLERVQNSLGKHVFIDYAHTPDALRNVLKALRDVGFQRVVCVFGCGGDRDRTKRPLMGAAVAEGADVAVLTSDNPRHEDPLHIIDDVVPGLTNAKEVIIEADRREALRKALELLKDDDVLLVAGKGHEQTQQIGDNKYPFSDRQTVQELLACY